MADLLARGAEEPVVRVFKTWAGEHGPSAEAEHRAILTAALMSPPRRKLADLLASMPNVGVMRISRVSPKEEGLAPAGGICRDQHK